MGMQGADIMQMQDLERRLQSESGAVTELQTRINSALANTQWTGPAADRFRQEWESNFSKALRTLSEALGQNAAAVRNRWQAFEAAAR
ncbi:MAG: WXG100 family type VII secretion target [Acidimicrobiia bacterium]